MGKIVEAAGTATSSRDPDLARRLEQAEVEAIHQAIEDGLSLSGDAEEILERKRKARAKVLAGE